jgi:hypothetical protein
MKRFSILLALPLLLVAPGAASANGPTATVRITGNCAQTDVWVDYSDFTPNDIVSGVIYGEAYTPTGNPWDSAGTGMSLYGLSGSGSVLVSEIEYSGWVGVEYAVDPGGPLSDEQLNDPNNSQIPIDIGLGDNPVRVEAGTIGACGTPPIETPGPVSGVMAAPMLMDPPATGTEAPAQSDVPMIFLGIAALFGLFGALSFRRAVR